MSQPSNNDSTAAVSSRWLRRVWAMLPLLSLIMLVGVIFILNSWIRSEGEIVKERKLKELAGEKAPINVVALELVPGPIREQISLPGVVCPWVELTVMAEVRGKIVAKKVTEGSRVRTGDVLAVIDERDYRNAYNSARAAWRLAKATHDRIATLFREQVATRSQMDDAPGRHGNQPGRHGYRRHPSGTLHHQVAHGRHRGRGPYRKRPVRQRRRPGGRPPADQARQG
jgi:hypothetical protein